MIYSPLIYNQKERFYMPDNLAVFVEGWLHKAKSDELTFYWILESENDLSDTACFHAQQAAEKWFKALMLQNNMLPPKTHDILVLISYLEGLYPELEDAKWSTYSEILNKFAVDMRYPFFKSSALIVQKPDLELVKAVLEACKEFCYSKLKLDINL